MCETLNLLEGVSGVVESFFLSKLGLLAKNEKNVCGDFRLMGVDKNLSRPFVLKVWGGAMLEEKAIFRTGVGEVDVFWDDVEFICIGRVRETIDRESLKADSPGKSFLKAMPLVGRIVRERSRQVIERENLLEALVFVKGIAEPFRFDSIGTNYREFLKDEAGYASERNFSLFFRKLIEKCKNAALDESAEEFYSYGKGRVRVYPSREKFIDKAWKNKGKL